MGHLIRCDQIKSQGPTSKGQGTPYSQLPKAKGLPTSQGQGTPKRQLPRQLGLWALGALCIGRWALGVGSLGVGHWALGVGSALAFGRWECLGLWKLEIGS